MMKKQQAAWVLSAWVAFQAAIAGVTGYGVLSTQKVELLPAGAHVGAVSVGNFTPAEAVRLVGENLQAAGFPAVIELILEEETFLWPAETLKLQVDVQQLDELLNMQLAENSWERLLKTVSASEYRVVEKIQLPIRLEEDVLHEKLTGIASQWNRTASLAYAVIEDEQIRVEPGVSGREMLPDVLSSWIQMEISQGLEVVDGIGRLDPSGLKNHWMVEIPTEIDEAWLAQLRPIGMASVQVQEGYSRDAQLAADIITLFRIEPDETLQLSQLLSGDDFQSADAGSRVATAIHTALLQIPGMTILERHPAPYTTNYALPGQEAVVGENLDLVFVNDTGLTILMAAASQGEALYVAFFGPSATPAASLFSDVVETSEPPLIISLTRELPPGEIRIVAEGKAGIKVDVYRLEGGEKVLLHTDYYPPQNRVVEAGAEPEEASRK